MSHRPCTSMDLLISFSLLISPLLVFSCEQITRRSYETLRLNSHPTSLNNDSTIFKQDCGRNVYWYGESQQYSSGVIGGFHSLRFEFPWHVMLLFEKKSNSEPYLCSGSIIDDSMVLTAGHCCHGNVNM